MRFVPALGSSLALCLPTSANAKGGHCGSHHVHRLGRAAIDSSSAVPRDSHGMNSRAWAMNNCTIALAQDANNKRMDFSFQL
jgi:hypothetical protein